MPRKVTPAVSLVNLRKEAKRWLKALRANDAEAIERFKRSYPGATDAPVLRDVQHALAREHGLENWKALTSALPTAADKYHQAAQDFVDSYERKKPALARLNAYYERAFSFDDVRAEIWRRVYAFRERSSRVPKNYLHLDEARLLVAQDRGFGSWDTLMTAAASGAPPPGAPYVIDSKDDRIGPSRRMTMAEWDELIEVMRERRITALDANGMMTDAAMERVAGLEHLKMLNLGGSRELPDAGLRHLARMPQLEALNLSEYPGGKLTDNGMTTLRELKNLRRFEMTWQSGITDASVANLRGCEHLEEVNLMGSPTGDGAIEALQGKPKLSHFSTGRLVTDAGLPLLRNYPALSRLMVDGPFTDRGLDSLAGMEALTELDLFWHVSGITSNAFAALGALPNLLSLACDGKLSDDTAMAHIGAFPKLRNLRAQESVATDAGFEALSRSRTLEGFWGRVCPNFGSRGFVAFSKMPSLRKLGVGCKNVDDRSLSTLSDFPALEELTPIGVGDDGFRHVGRCRRLRRLTCMYCRESGDAATEHITGLEIVYYYAGLTQITDRSLAMLSKIVTLEQIELYECRGVTDAGLPFLAGMPKLREVHLDGLPGVTLDGTKVFPSGVRVKYST